MEFVFRKQLLLNFRFLAADQESSKPSDPDTGFDDLFSNANQDGQVSIFFREITFFNFCIVCNTFTYIVAG